MVMRRAVISSVGSQGLTSLYSVVVLMEVCSVDGGDASSPLGLPVLRSCEIGPACGGERWKRLPVGCMLGFLR